MQIHQLKPNTRPRESRRIGRGGKRGTTAGRGTKGQKARAGAKIRPAIRDILKRIPKRRGRGKHAFRSFRPKPVPVSLSSIARRFPSGSIIDKAALLAKGLVRRMGGRIPEAKILGASDLKKKFTVRGLALSRKAREKIEAAGGTVQ